MKSRGVINRCQRSKRLTRGSDLKLTFLENKFVLQGLSVKPANWQNFNYSDSCYTTNLSEAARFRSVADKRAEYILENLALKKLPIPPSGPLSPKHKTLFDFQAQRGVPHILSGNKTYIAHEPGLGKSAQFICAVNTKPGPATIICPSFLKTTWAREITDWYIDDFPSIDIVQDLANESKMNWHADFLICSDAMIEKPWVQAHFAKLKTRHLAIDEAHRYKTPNTNRSIALFGGRNKKIKSPGLIYKSEHVAFLSGTPLLNRPIELWPILYGAAPELIDFMPYQDFGFRYGGAVQDDRGHWKFLGSANEDELNKKIMGRFMQRITKAEVLPDLPPKIRQILNVDTDNRKSDVKELDQALRALFRKTKVTEGDSLGDYAKLRHANGLAKVDWVAGVVSAVLSTDLSERIILFAHHRDVVAKLADALRALQPMVINGGVASHERTTIQDLFQSGRRRLIIGNIDSMNLGLTLTKATRVMFAEYAWTDALNVQAEDRAHRIGLQDSVFCQYFVLPGSFDEVMLTRVWDKQDKIERVMR